MSSSLERWALGVKVRFEGLGLGRRLTVLIWGALGFQDLLFGVPFRV